MNGSSGFELLAADLNARLLKFDAETLTLITDRSVLIVFGVLNAVIVKPMYNGHHREMAS